MADVTMQYINYIKGWLASTRRRLTSIKGRQASRVERAQLLLITALALAVILVTVALLLNAAIFTENVATRDTTADGHEAIELRGELVDGIGELIERENRQGQTHDELVENVSSGSNETELMVDLERARSGTVATLSHDPNAIKNGKLLRWDDPDEPRSFDGLDTNGPLVEELNDTRAFELNLTEIDSMSDPNATEIENEAFGIRFLTPDKNVTQYIYVDTERFENDRVVIANATEENDPQTWCSVTQKGNTIVDLTGDRITTDYEQRECYRGLWPDDDPHTIEFVNGEAAEGTFTITVDNEADPTSDSSVQINDALYSVTVDIGYQSQDLTFETTARVAPGEPR